MHFKKSSPLTFGCVKKNELNGPGSRFSIRLFKFSFFTMWTMVLVEINQKVGIKENTRMEPAATGLFFVFCHRVHREHREMKKDLLVIGGEVW